MKRRIEHWRRKGIAMRPRLLAIASAVVAASSWLVPTGAPPRAGELTCEHADGAISGGTRPDAETACRAARKAAGVLARCGIAQAAHLRLEIVDDVIVSCGMPSYGIFDPEAGTLKVVSSRICQASIPSGPGHALVGPTEAHESIVVHEIVHALLWQSPRGRRIPRVAFEHVADAVQVASMPEHARARFLQAFPSEPPTALSGFNDLFLHIAPHHFAAQAFLHFSAPSNGCRVIREILSGAARFPLSDE